MSHHPERTDAEPPNTHELTLQFDRFLSEDEWRDVVERARLLPFVKRLRANAVFDPFVREAGEG